MIDKTSSFNVRYKVFLCSVLHQITIPFKNLVNKYYSRHVKCTYQVLIIIVGDFGFFMSEDEDSVGLEELFREGVSPPTHTDDSNDNQLQKDIYGFDSLKSDYWKKKTEQLDPPPLPPRSVKIKLDKAEMTESISREDDVYMKTPPRQSLHKKTGPRWSVRRHYLNFSLFKPFVSRYE